MRAKQTREFIAALEQHVETQAARPPIELPNIVEHTDVAACFLGPKAENADILAKLIAQAVQNQVTWRTTDVHPADPPFITADMKSSAPFQATEELLFREFGKMLDWLRASSTPFFSMRHQGHMLWDMTLPGIAGYFGAMLFNQNNVAVEASPATTMMEIQVGLDMCRMLGYEVPSQVNPPAGAVFPWGHITCDGSVANLESLWMARNLKFYAAAVQAAFTQQTPPPFPQAALDVMVTPYGAAATKLISLDPWTVLNLPIEQVLQLPVLLQSLGVDPAALQAAVLPFTVQALGMAGAYAAYLAPHGFGLPVYIVPATKHYSWTKAGLILGIGSAQMLEAQVDLDARACVLSTSKLSSSDKSVEDLLFQCLGGGGTPTPVMSCISVMGSTEENAIDSLTDLMGLRDQYRAMGREFVVHVDGAWGGYFASMFRASTPQGRTKRLAAEEALIPNLPLSDYVTAQYRMLPVADSITVDPHKSGYIPYPAGGLCYRDSNMRNLVSVSSPVVYRGGAEPTVGIYGVEGSKPGAAAAAVYLSHRVIPTDNTGYGKILGECHFTNKKLYARLVTMASPDDPFVLVPLQRIPAEKQGLPPKEIQAQLALIRDAFVGMSNADIIASPYFDLFRQLGSDGVITTFAFNFKHLDGSLNQDINAANAFNTALFNAMSYQPSTPLNKPPLIVTSSEFGVDDYGATFITDFQQRMGCTPQPQIPVYFLISTQMDPWTTETSADQVDGFLGVIQSTLRSVVLSCLPIQSRPATPPDATRGG